ncbi:PTS sugar transporter subunit IIA [Crassaminicella profunda]|uniref:PTS sugar transporter subunit IIA n=1 Tax=Crassaminicella profunda TaxID=1286698 RepID=UPI001CA6AB30|nr:PTS sugar transporter subunit IIA [Crassaminicella profunda]QZY55226.1 PTS sugar transporter subunit IIA [Crassaminicella profunda]
MSKKLMLNEEVVAINVSVESREQLLHFMADMLKKEGYVKETYAEAILQREEKFSTGLPTEKFGVAIPHTDAVHVNEPMISIVTLKEPIQFLEMGNPDGEVDVKIVFMLAMKDSDTQVKLLTNLMGIVQNQELLKEIYEANKEQLILLINNKLSETY